jgi:hypothetical protein
MDVISGTSEFKKLPEELQQEMIKSKKEGTWISSSHPLDMLTKKLSYLKYIWTQNH